jgi:hypothetical protein
MSPKIAFRDKTLATKPLPLAAALSAAAPNSDRSILSAANYWTLPFAQMAMALPAGLWRIHVPADGPVRVAARQAPRAVEVACPIEPPPAVIH